jgi:hypothetical protein
MRVSLWGRSLLRWDLEKIMKYFASSALAALLVAGAAVPAMAVDATQTANGSITVLQPLTITKNDDLVFGTVIRPASGSGSIAVSAASSATRTPSGGVVALASTSYKAAKFTISGEGAQMLTVGVPATFLLANSSGTGSLTVTTTNDIADLSNVQLSGSLGGLGTKVFHVGGSIPITDATNSGAYTGTFDVTASYN